MSNIFGKLCGDLQITRLIPSHMRIIFFVLATLSTCTQLLAQETPREIDFQILFSKTGALDASKNSRRLRHRSVRQFVKGIDYTKSIGYQFKDGSRALFFYTRQSWKANAPLDMWKLIIKVTDQYQGMAFLKSGIRYRINHNRHGHAFFMQASGLIDSKPTIMTVVLSELNGNVLVGLYFSDLQESSEVRRDAIIDDNLVKE